MSKKHYAKVDEAIKDYPDELDKYPFFNLNLDSDQLKFRDAIWSKDYDIIFCDAKAGSGKTLVALSTAFLMYSSGRCDGIVYIVSPTQETKTGFLPGTAEDKIMPYITPLRDALLKIDLNPDVVINQSSGQNQKEGSSFIDCCSHAYLRGVNFDNKVVILDECQNMYLDEVQKTLTRVNDSCKTIVIGHHGQCDLYKNSDHSGFVLYKEWFKDQPRAAICELHTNHRGWVSTHADEIDVQAIYKRLANEEETKKIELEEKVKNEYENIPIN